MVLIYDVMTTHQFEFVTRHRRKPVGRYASERGCTIVLVSIYR